MAMEVSNGTKNVPERRVIRRPFEAHVHLRDGAMMASVVGATAQVFGQAVIQPNLQPPVTTVELAQRYHERIVRALVERYGFSVERATRFVCLTLYLTETTSPDEIRRAKKSGIIHGMKCYPVGITTGAEKGVRDLKNVVPQIEALQEVDLPLLLHGETADLEMDVFRRENDFVAQRLEWLYTNFPRLRISLEHITTRVAVEAVLRAPKTVVATITPQHLMYWYNDMLGNGIRPHLYCKPILKGKSARARLREVATSGNPKFILGTDSAPHAKHTKENDCGCAGCYSANQALEHYAEVFEQEGALHRLEGFASDFGPDFYQLPRSEDMIALERKPLFIPLEYEFGEYVVVPLRAGETIPWRVEQTEPMERVKPIEQPEPVTYPKAA